MIKYKNYKNNSAAWNDSNSGEILKIKIKIKTFLPSSTQWIKSWHCVKQGVAKRLPQNFQKALRLKTAEREEGKSWDSRAQRDHACGGQAQRKAYQIKSKEFNPEGVI